MRTQFNLKGIPTLKSLSFLVGLGLMAALSSCSTTTEPLQQEDSAPVVAEKLQAIECGEISNIHAFGDIWLAGQPSPADFEQASKSGVKTVINLRHDGEIRDFDEPSVVTGLGLNYIHLPWAKPDELTDEVFDQTREYLNTAERPILLHCGSANRVGALWIPWRVLDGGLTFDEALAEAKTVGLRTPDYIDRAREYLDTRM